MKEYEGRFGGDASVLYCDYDGIYVTISEKAMAPRSSGVAWRIPGTGEPGRLPSMGSHRVRHDLSDLAAAACDCMFVKLIMLCALS